MEVVEAIGAPFSDVRLHQQQQGAKAIKTRRFHGRPSDLQTVLMIHTTTIPEATLFEVRQRFRTVACMAA